MITAHVCHPSLANDNLSGIVVATELARTLAALPSAALHLPLPLRAGDHRLDHLAQPQRRRAAAGSGTGWSSPASGGAGGLVYKRTRRGDARTSTARPRTSSAAAAARCADYSPYGYDERQFNSLGFDLPFGRLSRTPHGEYPEYHTSADDLAFVRPRRAGGVLPRGAARSSTSWRTTGATRTSARTASRSWASAGSTRRRAASGHGRGHGDAVGPGLLRRVRRRCWTSPPSPAPTSRPCAPRRPPGGRGPAGSRLVDNPSGETCVANVSGGLPGPAVCPGPERGSRLP